MASIIAKIALKSWFVNYLKFMADAVVNGMLVAVAVSIIDDAIDKALPYAVELKWK